MAKKPTNAEVSKAARILSSDRTGKKAKSAASEVLSQAKTKKRATEKKVASKAGRVLSASTSSRKEKSTAATVLARSGRTVKSPKGTGTIKKSAIKRAVKTVSANRSGRATAK
jgi:hypothetical protein